MTLRTYLVVFMCDLFVCMFVMCVCIYVCIFLCCACIMYHMYFVCMLWMYYVRMRVCIGMIRWCVRRCEHTRMHGRKYHPSESIHPSCVTSQGSVWRLTAVYQFPSKPIVFTPVDLVLWCTDTVVILRSAIKEFIHEQKNDVQVWLLSCDWLSRSVTSSWQQWRPWKRSETFISTSWGTLSSYSRWG